MHILIDACLIRKPRGLGTYVRELLQSLEAIKTEIPDCSISAVMPRSARAAAVYSFVEPIYVDDTGGQAVWEQWRLPRVIREIRPDVVHHPYNTVPIAFSRERAARVVTIHDTMFLKPLREISASPYQMLGALYRRATVAIASRHAEKLISPSQRSSEEVMAAYRRPSTAVHISPSLFLASQCEMPSFVHDGVDFFLHVGGISPHKNTAAVIRAFEAARLHLHARLVVIGMNRLPGYGGKDWLELPGALTLAEVKWLYTNCKAVFFPSLVEGFGLPVVEAIVCSAALLTSDRDPMKELAGGAALLVDPDDEVALVDGMRRIAQPELALELRHRAALKAKEYSHYQMARATVDVYRAAFAQRRLATQ